MGPKRSILKAKAKADPSKKTKAKEKQGNDAKALVVLGAKLGEAPMSVVDGVSCIWKLERNNAFYQIKRSGPKQKVLVQITRGSIGPPGTVAAADVLQCHVAHDATKEKLTMIKEQMIDAWDAAAHVSRQDPRELFKPFLPSPRTPP